MTDDLPFYSSVDAPNNGAPPPRKRKGRDACPHCGKLKALHATQCWSCRIGRAGLASRFGRSVDRGSGSDGCWEWTAHRTRTGYGQIKVFGRPTGAHRAAWLLARGPIPDGLWVLHHCDNRGCVNPAHLFLGTVQDNVDDMRAKGRGPDLRGENQPAHRLTAEQVVRIRERHAAGESYRLIALDYGVHKMTVAVICQGKRWAHV